MRESVYYGVIYKEHAYITQRAIYSEYKKLHGLTNLDLCLPNGLHYMYGSYSMRCSNRTMVNMSKVDTFYIPGPNLLIKFYGAIVKVHT